MAISLKGLRISFGSETGTSQVKISRQNKVTLPSQRAYVKGTVTAKQCKPYVLNWRPSPLNVSH